MKYFAILLLLLPSTFAMCCCNDILVDGYCEAPKEQALTCSQSCEASRQIQPIHILLIALSCLLLAGVVVLVWLNVHVHKSSAPVQRQVPVQTYVPIQAPARSKVTREALQALLTKIKK